VEARPREIFIFETEDGRKPFSDWMDTVEADEEAYTAILLRIDRVEEGNFGDHKRNVGRGVHELRIDVSKGYRVYFGDDGDFVVLLHGGHKKRQDSDIEFAEKLWSEYNA
jgi:putative addiction module killer protein